MTIASSLNLGVAVGDTASTIASRDAYGNTAFNAISQGITSTATSAQSIALSISSTPLQIATGASTITYVLPQATTLFNGHYFNFVNNSSAVATIETYGGSTLCTIGASGSALVTLTNNSTSAGTWEIQWLSAVNSNAGYLWTNNSSTASPTWQSITQGNAVAPASGSTQACAVNTIYYVTAASGCVLTLPATAAAGSIVGVVGNGAGGWTLEPNTGQTIKVLTASASTSVASGEQYDCISVMCTVANTTWVMMNCVTTGFTVT